MGLLHAIWALIVTIWTWSVATPVHAMVASYLLGSAWNAVIRWKTTKDWPGFVARHPRWAGLFKASKAIFGDWWGGIGALVVAAQAKLRARASGGPVPVIVAEDGELKVKDPEQAAAIVAKALKAVVLFVALAMLTHQSACTPLIAPARTPYGTVTAASDPARCQSLSDRSTTWEAIAVGSGAAAGAGGLGGLEIDPTQKGARAAVALTSVGLAALAAAAAVVAHDNAARFVTEGCGQ